MKSNIKAIDIHSHINHGSIFDSEEQPWESARIEKLSEMNKAANIETMFCSTFGAVLSDQVIEEENEYMFELSQKTGNVFQWVVIDPRQQNTFVQAERMLKNDKCIGVKIHPSSHKYDIEEHGDKVFSFVKDLKTVVLIHPKADADYILPFADKYPDVNFILAHIWGKPHVDAIEYSKHGNVYVDTSGSASMQNGIIEYAVERVGSTRILFGTDTYSAGAQRGRIDYAQISETDKYNILRGNAEKLFTLK